MDILARLQAHLGDRFDVQREVGRGGMATVYGAVARDTGEQVAIKVMLPELSATMEAERFTREIAVASRLSHPHILGCRESGAVDGLLFYIMPFVDGESVRDRLQREGQFSVTEAVRIITEVADAIGYAHEQGVVHRDIKPENILLQDGKALVADFGIARAFTEDEAKKLTQTGLAVGTLKYMSPEQCIGAKAGPASDIYALGCMLYEMLAGEPPFTGINATAIMSRHVMDAVPSVRIVRPSVPEEVEEVIYAAMEKTPADRPSTCAEFVQILQTKLGDSERRRATRATLLDATAPVTTLAPVVEPVPWWKRRAVLAGAGAAVLVAAGAGWWGLTRKGGGTTGEDAHRIAVLYFEDQTPKKELGDLADGLTEGLIGSLRTVPSLYVVSRGGSELFRESDASPDSIGKALGVGVLVRGALDRDGDKLVANVRLVDAASGADISRARVAYAANDPLVLKDSLTSRVAELIRAKLGEEIKVREQRDATRNEAAWVMLQRAEAARKRGEKALADADRKAGDEAFRVTDSLLVAAAALDPKWPEPLAMRAMLAYRRARLNQADPQQIRLWVDSGLIQAGDALQRATDDPNALEARGNLRYVSALFGLETDARKVDDLIDSARADLERATTLNPLQAGAWATLSHLYYRVGNKQDVNTAARKALEADAYLSNADVVLNRLFNSSYDLGDFTPRGEAYCAQLTRRFPTSGFSARCQLLMLTTNALSPAPAKAQAFADSVVARTPEPQKALERRMNDLYVAAVMARAGLGDSARRVIARSIGDAQVDPTRDLQERAAFVYVLLGDTTAAIGALKTYFNSNEARRFAFREDPGWWFKPIAATPAFQKLVGAQP